MAMDKARCESERDASFSLTSSCNLASNHRTGDDMGDLTETGTPTLDRTSSPLANLSQATDDEEEKDTIKETPQEEKSPSGQRRKLHVSRFVRMMSTMSLGTTSKHSQSTNNANAIQDENDGDCASDDEETCDRRRLTRALRDAGRYADGVSAVEVWTFDSHHLKLVQPEGGWWRDPDFYPDSRVALERLEDTSRPDHVAANPLHPGVGLAGKLWAETSTMQTTTTVLPTRRRLSHGASTRSERDFADSQGPSLHRNLSERVRSFKDGEAQQKKDQHRQASFAFIEDVVGCPTTDVTDERKTDVEHPTGIGTGPFVREKHDPVDRDPVDGQNGKDDKSSDRHSQSSSRIHNRRSTGSMSSLRMSMTRMDSRNRTSSRRLSILSKSSSPGEDGSGAVLGGLFAGGHSGLFWRDLKSLSADPDHPTFLRLSLLEEAGFGQAAGVPFDIRGHRGIVVYLAKSDVSKQTLATSANEDYLQNASVLVGAVVALTAPRKASVASKEANKQIRDGSIPYSANEDHLPSIIGSSDCLRGATKHIKTWGAKWLGGGLQPPPPMTSSQTLLTYFGALVTLLILGRTSEAIKAATDGRHSLVMGPFGALMTLQYGLVMAPASQPRSALFGQSVAISIALLFSYVPESALPVWVRVALATATAISALTRLGITHPPAGASAVIFSSGGSNWISLLLLLLGNVISIITGIIINNLSDKRQYPTFWHFLPPSFYSAVGNWLVDVKKPGKAMSRKESTTTMNGTDSTGQSSNGTFAKEANLDQV